MSDLPLFDSLSHPMPDGNWLQPRYAGSSKAEDLVEAMQAHGVQGTLAVGMGDQVGGYREESYCDWVVRSIPGALPIAWFGFTESDLQDVPARMAAIRERGYRGIKIHPRRCGIDFRHPRLREVVRAAHEADLPVLLCTYNYARGRSLEGRGLGDVQALLDEVGDARIILLHGGVFHCLEWAEAIRPYTETLLDLSFTMTRFAGSSLDLDIRYLFQHFDQRICVGSDHPELSLENFRARFNAFSEGMEPAKAAHIAHANLNRCFRQEAW